MYSHLKSIGITNQRETTILWDSNTGQPFGNAILWSDTRNAALVERLAKNVDASALLTKITGLPVSTYFSATKIIWILQNNADAMEAALQGRCMFGTVDTWLLYKLTGSYYTDATNASRTQLMDLHKLQWSDEALSIMATIEPAIKAVRLPPIKSTSWNGYGTIQYGSGKGIRVTAMIGDQQSALLGQECTHAGQVKATYGTGVFVLLHTGEQVVASRHGLLSTVAYTASDGVAPQYALEGSVASGGSVATWLRDSMGIISSYAALDPTAQEVPDTGGVTFVPCLGGLLAPHWRPDTRGTLLGLSQHTSRGHIVRAALQGVALQTVDVLEALRADTAPLKLECLKVDGGLSASRVLLDFQARAANVDVMLKLGHVEATALGAARSAAIADGLIRYGGGGGGGGSEIKASEWETFSSTWSKEEREKVLERWSVAVKTAIGWKQ